MSKLEFLSPQNCAIALIDYQPAMYQGVQSHDRLGIFNNIQILAKTAKLFGIPTVISTVAKDSFSGPFMPEVTELFPDHRIIDRTSMNSWLDAKFREAVHATGGRSSWWRVCGQKHVSYFRLSISCRRDMKSMCPPTHAVIFRSKRTTDRWIE